MENVQTQSPAVQHPTVIAKELKVVINTVGLNKKQEITTIITSDGQRFPIVSTLRNNPETKALLKAGSIAVVNNSGIRTKRTNPETGNLEDCPPYSVNEVTAVFADINSLAAAMSKSKIVAAQADLIIDAMVKKSAENFDVNKAAEEALKAGLI